MNLIAVLEDDGRRIAAMRSIATELPRDCELEFFSDANAMVKWLIRAPNQCAVLSLDCDLDASALTGDDCGSGEDVTAFLSTAPHQCAVIIHSSNALRAPAMHLELSLAGWKRVWLRPLRVQTNGPVTFVKHWKRHAILIDQIVDGESDDWLLEPNNRQIQSRPPRK